MQSVTPSCSYLIEELTYEGSSTNKKDRLEYVKSHSNECKIYRFSHSTNQNFLRCLTNIFKDFESPSKIYGIDRENR